MVTAKYEKHYQESAYIPAIPDKVFSFADIHTNFSSHMNQGSPVMGGGKMETHVDQGKGQMVGSHITMRGKVFGIILYLDEVITRRNPPFYKEWETVGKVNLLVIDQYKLGFEIKPRDKGSVLRVFINYDLPKSVKTRWLGIFFSEMYAKWCVRQMLNSARQHFIK